ncbi:hypothetical protein AB3M83_08950 [Microbacterium sp. 179-B 1A2 NHS]|uniref:hypothetical protein n=1 Tax=Microbacterium sp. 179-B 1A2 NHS TaxID=3142383 RepID=UPI0039A1D922
MSRKKNWDERPERRGGPSRFLVGVGPYVSVYCSGREIAPHPKHRIASFVPSDDPAHNHWVESTAGYAAHAEAHYFKVIPRATQWLVGDRWLEPDERRDARDANAFRSRWRLQCPHCRIVKPFANPTQLSPAISALALLRGEDGIIEVPLRAFVRHIDEWGNG